MYVPCSGRARTAGTRMRSTLNARTAGVSATSGVGRAASEAGYRATPPKDSFSWEWRASGSGSSSRSSSASSKQALTDNIERGAENGKEGTKLRRAAEDPLAVLVLPERGTFTGDGGGVQLEPEGPPAGGGVGGGAAGPEAPGEEQPGPAHDRKLPGAGVPGI